MQFICEEINLKMSNDDSEKGFYWIGRKLCCKVHKKRKIPHIPSAVTQDSIAVTAKNNNLF